jgi:hypothetical protein
LPLAQQKRVCQYFLILELVLRRSLDPELGFYSTMPFEKRHGFGLTTLSSFTESLTKKAMGKKGFVSSSIVSQWPNIVGSALSAYSLPLKISFPPQQRQNGLLHIHITTGSLALEMQHLKPLIIERINGHFGYSAIKDIVLIQGFTPPPPQKTPKKALDLTTETYRKIDDICDSIPDQDLKNSLKKLGERLCLSLQKK